MHARRAHTDTVARDSARVDGDLRPDGALVLRAPPARLLVRARRGPPQPAAHGAACAQFGRDRRRETRL